MIEVTHMTQKSSWASFRLRTGNSLSWHYQPPPVICNTSDTMGCNASSQAKITTNSPQPAPANGQSNNNSAAIETNKQDIIQPTASSSSSPQKQGNRLCTVYVV